MAKKVRYNGRTLLSCYGNLEPINLVIGNVYDVVSEIDRGWYSFYTLNGVVGEFNSLWFDEIDDKPYMAISHEVPMIGKQNPHYKIEFINGKPKLSSRLFMSIVEGVNYIGDKIYQITTCNSVYIVKVE